MHPIRLATTAAFVATFSPAFAQWDPRALPATPAGRVNAAMAYDAVSGGVILFGGTTTQPAPSNQTWRYDGANWSLLAPPTSPSGRYGVELAFDSLRNVCVLYGGWTSAISIGTANNQTWEWNGTTWTQAQPANNPGARVNYAMAFDAGRGRTVLYGGSDNLAFPIPFSDTWEWNGTNWTQVATAGNPGPLDRAAMCYHAAAGKIVLFGGVDALANGNDTTWLYDGVSWTAAVVPGPRPPARTGAGMAYDSVRQVCVLTSGMHPTTGVRFTDTWEWNGAAWTLQPTATTGVLDGCVAYLPTNRQTVKFGGLASTTPFVVNAETWEFGAKYGTFGTGCAGSGGVPTLSAVDAPRLGQPFVVDATQLAPGIGLAILFVDFAPLVPLDLTFAGMPNCTLLAWPVLTFPMTGTAGSASWTWPTVSGQIGDTFYGQAISIDPAANTLGCTVSNAFFARVGH